MSRGNPHSSILVRVISRNKTTLSYEDKHLPIPANLAANIEYDWYESGHMVYVRDESLKQLHDRVAAFIKNTAAGNK